MASIFNIIYSIIILITFLLLVLKRMSGTKVTILNSLVLIISLAFCSATNSVLKLGENTITLTAYISIFACVLCLINPKNHHVAILYRYTFYLGILFIYLSGIDSATLHGILSMIQGLQYLYFILLLLTIPPFMLSNTNINIKTTADNQNNRPWAVNIVLSQIIMLLFSTISLTFSNIDYYPNLILCMMVLTIMLWHSIGKFHKTVATVLSCTSIGIVVLILSFMYGGFSLSGVWKEVMVIYMPHKVLLSIFLIGIVLYTHFLKVYIPVKVSHPSVSIHQATENMDIDLRINKNDA